jgi:hypothetical protein
VEAHLAQARREGVFGRHSQRGRRPGDLRTWSGDNSRVCTLFEASLQLEVEPQCGLARTFGNKLLLALLFPNACLLKSIVLHYSQTLTLSTPSPLRTASAPSDSDSDSETDTARQHVVPRRPPLFRQLPTVYIPITLQDPTKCLPQEPDNRCSRCSTAKCLPEVMDEPNRD